jgi:hypothetical protein
MLQVLVLVMLVAAVALGWRYSVRQKKLQTAPVSRQRPPKTYHCVEVRKGSPACKAVLELGNTRFLPEEAPSLPLAGCTVARCTCSYIHHDDRREEDRRHPYKQWASLPPTVDGERREKTERRKSSESTFKPTIGR